MGVADSPLAIYLRVNQTAHQTPLMVSKQHEEQSCLPSLTLHFFFSAAVSMPTKETIKQKKYNTKCCLQVNYTKHLPIIQMNPIIYLSSCKFARIHTSSPLCHFLQYFIYKNAIYCYRSYATLWNKNGKQAFGFKDKGRCTLKSFSRTILTTKKHT